MRVLHIGKFFPPFAGGIERMMADLMPAQQRLGIEVSAVVHHHEFGAQSRLENFQEGDFQGENLRGENFRGGNFRGWRARTFGTLLYAPVSPSFPWVLRKAIREFKPDLLHVHMPNTSAFWALRSKLPIVTHWHSDVVPSRIDRRLAAAYKLYRPLERRLLKRSAAVITTSQRYLESSVALQPFREKCVAVPLGIDPSRLPEPDELSRIWARQQWPIGTCRVLTIGRMTYYKGQRHQIDAMDRDEGLSLVLVGEGDLRLKLEDQVTRLNLRERVNMPGYVNDQRMAALLAECDVFCLSSVERTEAFGIVLLEAMRYAKPIVAADVPGSGVGFVVEDDRNGLLVATEDADQLAYALRRVASEEGLAARLGIAGRRRFDEAFHIDAVAAAVSKVYEGVVGNADERR